MKSSFLKNIEKYEKKILGLKTCTNKKVDYEHFFNLAAQYEKKTVKLQNSGYALDNGFYIKSIFYYYISSFNKPEAKDKIKELNTKFAEYCYEDLHKEDESHLPYTVYTSKSGDICLDSEDAFNDIYFAILEHFEQESSVFNSNFVFYPTFLFHVIYNLIKNKDSDDITIGSRIHETTIYNTLDIEYQKDLYILPKTLYAYVVQAILTDHTKYELFCGMNAQSAYHIGLAHINGELVPKDINLGFLFLCYSAACGNSLAYLALGLMFTSYNGFFNKNNVNQLEFFVHAFILLICDSDLLQISSCYLAHVKNGVKDVLYDTEKVVYNFEIFEQIVYNTIICLITNSRHGYKFKNDINKDLFNLYEDYIENMLLITINHKDFLKSVRLTTAIATLLNTKYEVINGLDATIIEALQTKKKFKNKSNTQIILELLKFGIEKKHRLAIYEYLNFVIDNNLISVEDEPYVDLAVIYKFGEIVYNYSMYNFPNADDENIKYSKSHENNEDVDIININEDTDINTDEDIAQKHEKYMLLAAELSYPPAQFALSLDNSQADRALYFGFKALQNNYVLAYYSLSKLLMGQSKELAYTMLFLAAEYNYLPAIEALNKAKNNGDFQPFEYIKCIQKIEALAQHDDIASIMMFLIYDKSNILPHNPIKANFYLQKAIDLGSHLAFDILRNKNMKQDDYAYNMHTHLPSMDDGIISLVDFFKIENTHNIHFKENLAKLLSALFESLLKNQNFLCFRALQESYDNFFWNSMLIPDTLNKLREHIDKYSSIWTNFDGCIEQIFSFNVSLKLDYEINYQECESKLSAIDKTQQDNSIINMLKGMLCLRSICCKNDRVKACEYFTKAMNAGASEAFAMAFYSYTILDDDKAFSDEYLQDDLKLKDQDSVVKINIEQ